MKTQLQKEYKVYAEFTQDGTIYQPDETFTTPKGWKLDDPIMDIREKAHLPGVAFAVKYDTGRREKETRKPIFDTRTVILPVK